MFFIERIFICKVVLIISLALFNPLNIFEISFAQNIEAKLSGHNSSEAFHIINDQGDTLFSVRGDGSASFSNKLLFNSENYLFKLEGKNESPPGGGGRDVLVNSGNDIILNAAEASHGMTQGGQIIIYSGEYNSGFGGIEIIGGEDNETGAGKITLNAGDGSELNLYAGSSSFNYFGGDVNIESGSAGIGGDVNITAGEGVSEAGDIILTPGIVAEQTEDGLVKVFGSGTVSGSWTVSADERFKKNIEDLDRSIGDVIKLQPVKYELKREEFPDKNFERGEKIGLIAQEVEIIIPQLVNTDKDGYKSIDYSKLSVLLIEAVKEQQNEIEELKKIISELKIN
jgi:hypothetical protein